MANNYSTGGFFAGRATRSEYWKMMIILMVLASFLFFIFFISFAMAFYSSLDDLLIVWLISFVILCILGLPVTVRRYHDLNMSGWWVLGFLILGMLPIIGSIAGTINFILLGFMRGTEGTNNYGPDPLSPEPEEEELEEIPQLPQTQTHASSAEIKTRLEELKTLLDTGVISYEEYIAQRERILKEL